MDHSFRPVAVRLCSCAASVSASVSASASASANASDAPERATATGTGTTQQDGDSSARTTRKEAPPLKRPLKRARTAYFIFADQVRPSIQKEHPGEGVASQAKKIGAKWQSLSGDEKEAFRALATKEKERIAAELEAYLEQQQQQHGGTDAFPDHDDDANGNNNNNGNGNDLLVFPVARIRKIAKLDPEVKTLSKEALHLVVRSAELVLAKLGRESVKVARLQNRRTLLPDDVAHVCAHREAFRFLKDDISDLKKQQQRQQQSEQGGGGGGGNKKEAAKLAAASGSKPLTSYFGAAAASKTKAAAKTTTTTTPAAAKTTTATSSEK